MWTVEKTQTARKGYYLLWRGQQKKCPSWAPAGWFGWWKYKKDAVQRAKVYNGG